MTEPTPLLAPGIVVAETYEIERQLGRGGMGEVWLARHRRLAGKQVAIKILHVDRQLPLEALARFKREAEIAARLEHPNIVQVLDFNTLPTGQPYLVMEFLKGQSLSARARGKTFDLPQVASIMRQVGAALQAAHRAGVVHRDLKPENIFVIPTAVGDQVKVLDFGISKLSDSNTVQTTDSVLIGTPLYMSPEQALGHNSDVTPQSDLFSLGTICYELFTGQPPFTAESIAKVVFRIAYEKHAPLAGARPDLPAGAIAAVEHALEKERARRTKDIDSFVLELTGEALNEVAQDESSGVYSPGMQVTDSMGSGQTRAPSGGTPRQLATPSPTGSPAGPVKTVSGKKVIIALVGGALILSAVVAKVRTDNWAERSAYRAGMIDAGHQLLADGTFRVNAALVDAGPATGKGELAPRGDKDEAPDAGVPDASVAQVAVVVADAGPAVAVEAPKPKVPPTPIEQRLLDSMAKLEHQEKWDTIFEARGALRASLKTPSAREQGLAMLINATCARADNAQLLPIVNEYKTVATPAQVRAARVRCIKRYPSAEFLDW